MHRRVVSVFVIGAVVALPSTVRGQTPSELREIEITKKLEANWKSEKEKFAEVEKESQAALARRFDTVLDQVRSNPSLYPQIKANMIERLTAQKNAFLKEKRLPMADEMIGSLLDYEVSLHRARKPLLSAFGALSRQYAGTAQDQKLITLSKEKARIDRSIAGGGKFTPKTNWDGSYRSPAGSSTDFHLWVGGTDGSVFGGSVVASEGHVEYRVKGLIDGNMLHFETSEVIKGGKIQRAFEGFVLDRRMILHVSGRNADGKPVNGWVNLWRR